MKTIVGDEKMVDKMDMVQNLACQVPNPFPLRQNTLTSNLARSSIVFSF